MSIMFDAQAWLRRYERAGGSYAILPSGSLIFMTDAIDAISLEDSFAVITGRPERLASVRDLILQKEAG